MPDNTQMFKDGIIKAEADLVLLAGKREAAFAQLADAAQETRDFVLNNIDGQIAQANDIIESFTWALENPI